MAFRSPDGSYPNLPAGLPAADAEPEVSKLPIPVPSDNTPEITIESEGGPGQFRGSTFSTEARVDRLADRIARRNRTEKARPVKSTSKTVERSSSAIETPSPSVSNSDSIIHPVRGSVKIAGPEVEAADKANAQLSTLLRERVTALAAGQDVTELNARISHAQDEASDRARLTGRASGMQHTTEVHDPVPPRSEPAPADELRPTAEPPSRRTTWRQRAQMRRAVWKSRDAYAKARKVSRIAIKKARAAIEKAPDGWSRTNATLARVTDGGNTRFARSNFRNVRSAQRAVASMREAAAARHAAHASLTRTTAAYDEAARGSFFGKLWGGLAKSPVGKAFGAAMETPAGRLVGKMVRPAGRVLGAVADSPVGRVAGRLAAPLTVAAGAYEALRGYQHHNARQVAGSVGGTAGALAGGWAGAEVGAGIGAGIGVWVGGVGAVPGAAIGGFVGGIVGGVGGWWAGKKAAQHFGTGVAQKAINQVDRWRGVKPAAATPKSPAAPKPAAAPHAQAAARIAPPTAHAPAPAAPAAAAVGGMAMPALPVGGQSSDSDDQDDDGNRKPRQSSVAGALSALAAGSSAAPAYDAILASRTDMLAASAATAPAVPAPAAATPAPSSPGTAPATQSTAAPAAFQLSDAQKAAIKQSAETIEHNGADTITIQTSGNDALSRQEKTAYAAEYRKDGFTGTIAAGTPAANGTVVGRYTFNDIRSAQAEQVAAQNVSPSPAAAAPAAQNTAVAGSAIRGSGSMNRASLKSTVIDSAADAPSAMPQSMPNSSIDKKFVRQSNTNMPMKSMLLQV